MWDVGFEGAAGRGCAEKQDGNLIFFCRALHQMPSVFQSETRLGVWLGGVLIYSSSLE
jgi:hypothetical protein